MPTTQVQTGVISGQPLFQKQASALCAQFGIPLLSRQPEQGYFLYFSNDGLELRQAGRHAPGPIRVDFVSGRLAHRRRFGGGRGQPLARAVGIKPGVSPTVWDATAGLGRDAFVLASLGCLVTLCERSPVLQALLEDGLERARMDKEIGDWVRNRMQLVSGDSAQRLASLAPAQQPEVVYLDPMYPPGKRGVLVKKEMRALQQLLGADRDSRELFEVALQTAKRRVVIKRPKHAHWLQENKPDTCVESKKTRYDVYLTL